MNFIHKLFRNEDYSVNLGDLLRIVDNNLLTFAEGKSIGATLNKSSMEEYEHYQFSEISEDLDEKEIILNHAYDVVDVLANKDAVYQDFELQHRNQFNWICLRIKQQSMSTLEMIMDIEN